MICIFKNLWQGLRQDLRSKELQWLFIALIVSVSAMTSVSFLADRMHRAFQFDARQLLASDLLIAADQPLPDLFIEKARQQQLLSAQTVVFPSMATVGSQSKLASIKAVSSQYPLRGALQVESDSGRTIPSDLAPGTVFVEPALLSHLRAKVGDQVRLGERTFPSNSPFHRPSHLHPHSKTLTHV